MSFSLCLIFFLAPLVLCDQNVNDQVLLDVFGDYKTYSVEQQQPAATAASPQAKPAENVTLVDPDYWDSDEYSPSNLDYDQFDWTLTRRVAKSTVDNFLLSPLGLKLALAVLTEAATGATKSELGAVLGLNLDRNLVRMKFDNILSSLQAQATPLRPYILNLGSRIYVDNSAQPRQRFAAIAERYYKTDLKTVDFDNPTSAAKDINAWVADNTQGKIVDLISEEDVAGAAVLLLNTLYFKGSWRYQFPMNSTKPGTFYVSPTVQKKVSFMNMKAQFYYADSNKLDAKILRMPYSGNKFSMYIIVPNSLTGLPRVLDFISELRSELHYLTEQIVQVTLPKFEFEFTSLLDGVLKGMGIRQAFEDIASFPGIARGQLLSQRLRISKVLQRSGIEVNEVGTVAYSATEIFLVNKFGEDVDTYLEVIANKPFLFFIEDQSTRQLLFTGRISDPSSAKGTF